MKIAILKNGSRYSENIGTVEEGLSVVRFKKLDNIEKSCISTIVFYLDKNGSLEGVCYKIDELLGRVWLAKRIIDDTGNSIDAIVTIQEPGKVLLIKLHSRVQDMKKLSKGLTLCSSDRASRK
jgi:hypothetical protein